MITCTLDVFHVLDVLDVLHALDASHVLDVLDAFLHTLDHFLLLMVVCHRCFFNAFIIFNLYTLMFS